MRELFERYGLLPPLLPRVEAAERVTQPSQLMTFGDMSRKRGDAETRKMKRDFRTLLALSESPLPSHAITLIVDKVASLEYSIDPSSELKENATDYSKQIETVTNIIENPNIEDEDWSVFVRQEVEDLLVFDFACWEYVENPTIGREKNDLLFMYPVPGWSIERTVAWQGDPKKPRWVQQNGTVKVPMLDSQIEAIMLRRRTSKSYGLSPLEVAIGLIDSYLKLSSYQASVASEAYPAFMISLGEDVTDQADIDRMRSYWNNELAGQGRPGLFGGFKDPKSIQTKPVGDEGLYLKYEEVLKRAVAFTFKLKSQDFNISHDVNKNQGEMNQAASIEEAVKPYALAIAKRMTRRVIPRIAALTGDVKILDLEYTYETIDPWDEKEQTAIAVDQWEADAITHDELRDAIGKEPCEDGTGDMYISEYKSQFGVQSAPGQDLKDQPLEKENKTSAHRVFLSAGKKKE